MSVREGERESKMERGREGEREGEREREEDRLDSRGPRGSSLKFSEVVLYHVENHRDTISQSSPRFYKECIISQIANN